MCIIFEGNWQLILNIANIQHEYHLSCNIKTVFKLHPCTLQCISIDCWNLFLKSFKLLPESSNKILYICLFIDVGRPLWWEDQSVVCSAVIHWFESCRTNNHTLLPLLRLLQPGGPGPHIYIPQKLGDPVIPPFMSSLTTQAILAHLHTGIMSTPKLRPTVSQSVLVSGTHLVPATNCFPFFNYF
jgi:hypothetical protein